ncbi:MAG: flagellin [Caulobacteraceae bacterium]
MDRISTSQSYQSSLLNILTSSNRQTEAQNQVSTGKVAQDLKGYGVRSDTLTGVKSFAARLDSYVDNGKVLTTALDVQDQVLGEAAKAALDSRAAVAEAIATGNADGLLAALQGGLSQAVDALNTQYQGRYMFAGGQSDTKPANIVQLSDLTAAPSVASLFKNDNLAATNRLDDNVVISTGFLADDVGAPLMSALKAVQALNEGPSGPLSGRLTQAQSDALTGMLAQFDAAYAGLNENVAANGVQQNRVAAVQTALEDRQVAMKNVLANLTDVDMAEAVSRLQLAQTAMQASAQVFASLQGSSLLNALSR